MSWISGIVAGIGSGMQSRGEMRETRSANKWYGQNYNPDKINQYAQQFNPWVWNAMRGSQGAGTQFDKDMYNIAQGKDISPYLLNQPLNQINQGANRNMASMTAQLGRSNMSGGLANAYALSNQMGRQNSTANLFQNYGQWREQQRRSDLNWLMGLMNQSQGQGFDVANALGRTHKQGMSGWTKFGRSLSAWGGAGLGGMGGGGGTGGAGGGSGAAGMTGGGQWSGAT